MVNQEEIWDELYELETELTEWNQFLDHLLGERIKNNSQIVFGKLTLGQVIKMVEGLLLNLKNYLDLIKNGNKEKTRYLLIAEETQILLNHLERRLKDA